YSTLEQASSVTIKAGPALRNLFTEMDRLSQRLRLIISCRIRAMSGRSGLVICSHCADRVTGASNRKKRSVAIAVAKGSMVPLLMRGMWRIEDSKFANRGGQGGYVKNSKRSATRAAPHFG